LAETGFIDHIGIGVPDLEATKEYYDDLMSVLGLRQWFERSPGGVHGANWIAVGIGFLLDVFSYTGRVTQRWYRQRTAAA